MITTALNHFLAPRPREEAQEGRVSYLARKVMGPVLDVFVLYAAFTAFIVGAQLQCPPLAVVAVGIAYAQLGFGMYQLGVFGGT